MFKGVLGAVYLSLIAFTTVFAILILLSLIMFAFKFIFARKKEEKKDQIPKVITSPEESFLPEEKGEDSEEIAAVMAAVYASLASSGSSFRVRFIREISPDSYFWKRSYKLLRRR